MRCRQIGELLEKADELELMEVEEIDIGLYEGIVKILSGFADKREGRAGVGVDQRIDGF